MRGIKSLTSQNPAKFTLIRSNPLGEGINRTWPKRGRVCGGRRGNRVPPLPCDDWRAVTGPASSDYDEPDGHIGELVVVSLAGSLRSVGIVNYRFMWKLDISLKIEILWMMLRNCILNKDKPLKRRWTGNYQCHFSVAAKKLLISCCLVAL